MLLNLEAKYVKNISALYNKSQDTNPIQSNIFMMLGALDKEAFNVNDKNKIKNKIDNLFPILQLQDAEFVINSNKNIGSVKFKIYDIQGKLLENKTISLTNSINEIMINNINSSGVYLVEIISDSETKFIQKVLVN